MTDPMSTPPLDLTAAGRGHEYTRMAIEAGDTFNADEVKDLMAHLDIATARAEAAEKKVAKVREVHKPVPVYTTEAGDCEHDGDCEAVEISAGSYCPVHTDGLTCNECAELAEHADDLPAYPCPTITALDTHTPETETTP